MTLKNSIIILSKMKHHGCNLSAPKSRMHEKHRVDSYRKSTLLL